jgi:hydroxyethylthiazole kinase-like uncharacterized protein yjeF
MTPLYSVSEIREIEQSALAVLPQGTLMQRAGRTAAQLAVDLLHGMAHDAAVLILTGPGNNGGDALETAAHLAHAGWQVYVLLLADPERQSADAKQALQRAQNSPVHFLDASASLFAPTIKWNLVIDGLFGIGLQRPIVGELAHLVSQANQLGCPILALDVPSGLDADTGTIVGTDGTAIQASHTITFIGDKPGLHTCDGRDYAGQVQVTTLDIEATHFKHPRAYLNEVDLFACELRQRPQNSHKGNYGDVIVAGGAPGMYGATILASSTAAKCGAGRVFAAFLENPPAYDGAHPEIMCRLAGNMHYDSSTVVIGPGLGTSTAAHDLLASVLHTDTPLVLDADALNLIATEHDLQNTLAQRAGNKIITPHPLEAARLLAISSAEVQANRPAVARELAHRFNCVAVLKGSGTVIADPDDSIAINTTGNPALATAGTGDVLAGLCGTLLAQGWASREAALAAVWLHGKAADTLVEQGIGPIGLTASELIPAIRMELNRLVNAYVSKRSPRS